MLGVLMALTVIVAVKSPFGDSQFGTYAANATAITIAIVKAFLVISNFMAVKFSSKLIKFFAGMGFVGFGLFFIMFVDYATRKYEPVRGWEPSQSTAYPRYRTDQKSDEEFSNLGEKQSK
jgi:caa(3)-type oxidase subunit IV